MTGFSVSLPDLHGCADQLSILSNEYDKLGGVVEEVYDDAKNVSDLKSILAGYTGLLNEPLFLFQEDSDTLARALCLACDKPMSTSMASTAERLRKAAKAYRKQDEAAEAEVAGADPSNEAEKTADAITGGEPNSDWSTDFDTKDYVATDVDGDVIPDMAFKPTLETTMDTLMTVAEGPSFTSADALIEYICGFSPAKECVKPLLGDWGVLWFTANQYRAAASAVEEIGRILSAGADMLVGTDWTGDAADGYARSAAVWDQALSQHADLFRRAAVVLDDTANRMDDEGTVIAEACLTLADLAVEVVMTLSGRGGMRNAKKLIDDLAFVVPDVMSAIDSFKAFLDLSRIEIDKLVSEIASLNPPGNLHDNNK